MRHFFKTPTKPFPLFYFFFFCIKICGNTGRFFVIVPKMFFECFRLKRENVFVESR